MRKLLDIAFGVSLIGLALSALMAIPSDTPTSGAARGLALLLAITTIALFVVRRRASSADGVGLLKPGRYPKPEMKDVTRMTAVVTQMIQAGLRAKGRTTPESIVSE